jgi:hypothetical protein
MITQRSQATFRFDVWFVDSLLAAGRLFNPQRQEGHSRKLSEFSSEFAVFHG